MKDILIPNIPKCTDLEPITDEGNSAIYKGKYWYANGPVAIKILKDISDPLQVAAFTQEAATLHLLYRKNSPIVEFINFDPESMALIMEWMSGGDLEPHIKPNTGLTDQDGFLAVSAIGNIADFVGQALYYAHTKGVVHGDVKPTNILLDLDPYIDWMAKLADWGNAHKEDVTKHTIKAVTPAYAAPEQLEGQVPTEQSDIYSLGVVVYEMLTGQLPYEGIAHQEVDELITFKTNPTRTHHQSLVNIPKLSAMNLPLAQLDAVLEPALMRQPQQRYRHVDDFTGALGKALTKQTKPT